MAGLTEAVRRFLGLVVGENTPTTGAPPATATELEPMCSTTLAALRATIDDHDRGNFMRSALLAKLITRDADVFGALLQRLGALQAHETEITAPSKDARAVKHADFVRGRWPKVVTRAAQHDMAASLVLLGYAVGQLIWTFDEGLGELVPTLDPWPSESVVYERTQRRWYALTRDQGRVEITPGDGQWVLLTAHSVHQPHLWGALRPSAEWYLRNSFGANDTSKRAEVTGTPIWLAKLPLNARETADGRAFIRSIRNMGRNATIPLPQGREAHESYDLDLCEAAPGAHAIFEYLQRLGGGRIRIAILGQDLTSQSTKTGLGDASANTGTDVTEAVVEGDAHAHSDVYTAQISEPWTLYRTGDKSLTPAVCIDAEPESDAKADAEALGAEADALLKWRDLGVNVDMEKRARERGLPLLKGPLPPAPTSPTQPTPAPPGTTP